MCVSFCEPIVIQNTGEHSSLFKMLNQIQDWIIGNIKNIIVIRDDLVILIVSKHNVIISQEDYKSKSIVKSRLTLKKCSHTRSKIVQKSLFHDCIPVSYTELFTLHGFISWYNLEISVGRLVPSPWSSTGQDVCIFVSLTF